MRESIIASRSDVYIPLKPDLEIGQMDLDYSSGQIRHWQTSDLCVSIPTALDARPFGLIYERRRSGAAGEALKSGQRGQRRSTERLLGHGVGFRPRRCAAPPSQGAFPLAPPDSTGGPMSPAGPH